MQAEPVNDLYEIALRYAALPALALIIWLCWLITNYLMSMEWQRARRNKQIRKAAAARQKRFTEPPTADNSHKTDV